MAVGTRSAIVWTQLRRHPTAVGTHSAIAWTQLRRHPTAVGLAHYVHGTRLIRLQPWPGLNLFSCLKLSFLLSAMQKTLAALNTELGDTYHEMLHIAHMILGGPLTMDWFLLH